MVHQSRESSFILGKLCGLSYRSWDYLIYSERNNDTPKWPSHTFGLAYLDPQEVKDSFVFDIMPDAPSDDAACDKYADYLLSTHVSSDSKFSPELLASTPENSRRTDNAAEAFHSQTMLSSTLRNRIYTFLLTCSTSTSRYICGDCSCIMRLTEAQYG